MNSLAFPAVFRGVVAEKTQVKEIGRVRQKLERREIAFVQSDWCQTKPSKYGAFPGAE